MPKRLRALLAAGVCAVLISSPFEPTEAAALHDQTGLRVRGVGVNVAPPPWADVARIGSDEACPFCYKGYDYGQDCYQYVWTGFRQVWANVCLWGWR
jgi:hypothetical protein